MYWEVELVKQLTATDISYKSVLTFHQKKDSSSFWSAGDSSKQSI